MSKAQQQHLDRIEQRAILEGWPDPSPEIKQAIVNRQSKIAIDEKSTNREATAAFRALKSLWLDQKRIRLDQDKFDYVRGRFEDEVLDGPQPAIDSFGRPCLTDRADGLTLESDAEMMRRMLNGDYGDE